MAAREPHWPSELPPVWLSSLSSKSGKANAEEASTGGARGNRSGSCWARRL